MDKYDFVRRIMKLEDLLLGLKGIREDIKDLSSSVDDTILEVRHMIAELQINDKENKDGE